MSYIKLLGVDIAKHIFHLHGIDEKGHCVLTKKVNREQFLDTLIQLDCQTIVMEACGSSNYWARELKKHNRSVKLISPQFITPFVKRNKNDYKDAEAICEAASHPAMVLRLMTIKGYPPVSLNPEGLAELRVRRCDEELIPLITLRFYGSIVIDAEYRKTGYTTAITFLLIRQTIIIGVARLSLLFALRAKFIRKS